MQEITFAQGVLPGKEGKAPKANGNITPSARTVSDSPHYPRNCHKLPRKGPHRPKLVSLQGQGGCGSARLALLKRGVAALAPGPRLPLAVESEGGRRIRSNSGGWTFPS
jgi:hypothetical protein